MLGFLKRLFGEGKIRCDIKLENGDEGTLTIPYSGSLDTLTEAELLNEIIMVARVEHGWDIAQIRIDSMYGTTSGDPNWTGDWFTLKGRTK